MFIYIYICRSHNVSVSMYVILVAIFYCRGSLIAGCHFGGMSHGSAKPPL